MDIITFFKQPAHSLHKKYEALRAFYIDHQSAEAVAKQFGYTKTTVYSLTRDFKKQLQNGELDVTDFFNIPKRGRKISASHDELRELIILLRKKYLSVPDIKSILDAQQKTISERHIYNVLKQEGFARLPRRSRAQKQVLSKAEQMQAPKSECVTMTDEEFHSPDAGILIFLPLIKYYGIDQLLEQSNYPQTKALPKLNSLLAFVGLKLSNVRRYTADDLWCMDRGLGLFAGLNVLPKAAWFTSYSSRVIRQANVAFLKALHALWVKHDLLSETANLDFTSIPYWGEEDHLENNWSGTRHQALESLLAAIAHDPDTGIITYGDANVRHANESHVVIEFLDFYQANTQQKIQYLVFDSKFTTYENLAKLDEQQIKFITIRRRGKKIVDELAALPAGEWRNIRVATSNGKSRQIKVHDTVIHLKPYGKTIRQVAITGHGKIKPALIITNEFALKTADIVKKYARRWLVEKTISEQTHFFHLNRLSSSMVIKVDFDLTMTILAHNLYRLLANELTGFSHNTAQSLFEKFIHSEGIITCVDNRIIVKLKKKRRLPVVLDALQTLLPAKISWLQNRSLLIEGATTT